jgi:RNA polymerase sigma-70 factor (ECF subfamily)
MPFKINAMAMDNALPESILTELFAAYRGFLWSISYRLTGNAADADDVVQETFVRAWQRPPANTNEPWLPWLVRVASNVGHDIERWRRRNGWGCDVQIPDGPSPANPAIPLELLESVTAAFLWAMEVLTPRQQLLLMLRDVFECSVRETAALLDMSEANVKTGLHRARRGLLGPRTVPPVLSDQRKALFHHFALCLRSEDAPGIVALLAG